MPRAHYENFPGRVVAAARAACGRTSPPSTPLPAPPTTSPTKATVRPDERLRLLDGWRAGCVTPPVGRDAGLARRRRASRPTPWRSSVALGATIRRQRAAGRAVRGSAQRVPPGRHRHALRHLGRRCSTTAAARRTRSAGSCCGSPAIDDARLDAWSDAICTALQLTNFWQDLQIDFDRGRIYLPPRSMRAHGARTSDLDGGPLTPAWQRALAAAVHARGRCSTTAGRCATPCAAGCATSCARPGSAARASSTGSSRALRRRSRIARPRRRRRCRGSRGAWLDVVRPSPARRSMSRDTSFYYSFLVLPPRKRERHHRRLGLLPRRRRCRGRSGAGGGCGRRA